MEIITLLLFLSCAKTQVINESTESWTKTDQDALQRATKVCATDERYSDTPCLKKFYKREPLTYAAICGAAHKRSW